MVGKFIDKAALGLFAFDGCVGIKNILALFEGEWYISAAIVQPLKEEIRMKRRALVVITMCMLSVAVGISRISANRGATAAHAQTTAAAAEKSRHTDRAPHFDSGGKEQRAEKDKHG